MKKTNKKFNSTCCDIQGALFLPDQIQQAFLGKNKRQSRVCNFLWAARSRLIDVGGDSVTK